MQASWRANTLQCSNLTLHTYANTLEGSPPRVVHTQTLQGAVHLTLTHIQTRQGAVHLTFTHIQTP